VAIQSFYLGLVLEAEHHRVIRFRFSVSAVVNCGSRCKLASSSSTNHVFRFVVSSFIIRNTNKSSHRLMRE